MRIAFALLALLLPTASLAHIGHWAPVAGHDHIGLGIAIGVTVVAGLAAWTKARGKRKKARKA